MALAPGTKLGIYEIQSPLGAGGMGEVYRATDTKLGRDVALKLLALGALDKVSPEHLLREAQTASSLSQSFASMVPCWRHSISWRLRSC
jgi:eukaryotic-like serine/threonine-protein kinase